MSGNGQELQMFETHVLKVHINCEGCEQKVRKLLNKIEGVHSVNIDKEQQLVVVLGCVDSATLVKKLAKCGKAAEICVPIPKYYRNKGKAKVFEIQGNDLNPVENQYKFSGYFGNGNGDIESFENYINQNVGMETVNSGMGHGVMAETMMGNMYNLLPVATNGNNTPMMICIDGGDLHAITNGNNIQEGHALNNSIVEDMYMDQPRTANRAIRMFPSPDSYLFNAAP